jgi:hypothetical protein
MLAGRGAFRDEDIVALRIPGELQEGIGCGEISLIERARAGDDRAFEALIQRHKEKAYISIYKITRHREDTEDALQNAILNGIYTLSGVSRKVSVWYLVYCYCNQSGIDVSSQKACATEPLTHVHRGN